MIKKAKQNKNVKTKQKTLKQKTKPIPNLPNQNQTSTNPQNNKLNQPKQI